MELYLGGNNQITERAMINTPIISIICVVIASILGAIGQYLFKTATLRNTGHMISAFISPWAITGMICYISVMLLFTFAFRKGGTVTVLYPIYASTFIWSALIAKIFFNTPIRPVHLLGMLLLVGGMMLMGIGNSQNQ